jgi:glutamine phosphoribosylpyrophosphate amidotransferase
MCGIAGFSLPTDAQLDPARAGRVLMASVAERGADAAGCAWEQDGEIRVIKQPGGASRFLEHFELPAEQRHLLIHVRDFTKGQPSLMANNHPIRHGRIVGVHNGRITNDDAVIEQLGCGRAEPGMTVDSEAIFACLDEIDDPVQALERLRGSLACGWLDANRPGTVFLARGFGRPLWLARIADEQGGLLWASTVEALEIAEDFLGLRLHKRPVRPGTMLEIADGEVVETLRFRADATASWLPNPVASPQERSACLKRLRLGIA